MMKGMARKGAVGGTARWAAQGYAAFVNQNPNIETFDLYESLIKIRYAVMPNPEQESFLLGIADQIRGLRGLVVSILTVEAGFAENTPEIQQMFIEIIDEELVKHGVPHNVVSVTQAIKNLGKEQILFMNKELHKFLKVHVPGKGYHAHGGQIELYSEKKLYFQCGCGARHQVNNCVAIIDFPLENKGIYVCPNRDGIFSLVKATGILSVKGLKTIAFYKSANEAEQLEIMLSLESRKKRG